MNRHRQLLLRLQELNLLLQGMALAGAYVEEAGFDYLEERIERVRRQVPGPLLSQFDALSQRYPEPLAAVSGGVCLACEANLPGSLVSRLNPPNQLQCCPQCGRLLYRHESVPDYLGTK